MTDSDLSRIQCGTCGVIHAIPKAMHDNCLEEGGFWTCPNGHRRGYREGRKAREAVVRERDRLKQQVAQLNDAIAAANRKTEKVAKEASRLKKRSKAGVCLCCNRTFSNMAAHMKTKHPDLDPNVVDLHVEKKKRGAP